MNNHTNSQRAKDRQTQKNWQIKGLFSQDPQIQTGKHKGQVPQHKKGSIWSMQCTNTQIHNHTNTQIRQDKAQYEKGESG